MNRSKLLFGATLFLFVCGCTPEKIPVDAEHVIPLTNMVLIKPGAFLRAKHQVTITHDYWLAKYEVTQGEYQQLIGKNPSHFPEGPNYPVEKVTYYDAMAY